MNTHTRHWRTFEDNAPPLNTNTPLDFPGVFSLSTLSSVWGLLRILLQGPATWSLCLIGCVTYESTSYPILIPNPESKSPSRFVVTAVSLVVPFRLLLVEHLSVLCLGYLMLQLIPDLSASPRTQRHSCRRFLRPAGCPPSRRVLEIRSEVS